MTPARVLLAPDKFKGSLTAAQVAAAVGRGITSWDSDTELRIAPVADGGEGTVAAALAAGYVEVQVSASGPTGEPVRTSYARKGRRAVLELASVSGLAQLPGGQLAPLTASSRGIGEVLAAALDAGCEEIVIGIGGSACTDGGAGLLRALGATVRDGSGVDLPDGGSALAGAAELDLAPARARLGGASLLVACDVNNPLVGRTGAAMIYGPQKGADAGQVALLDRALSHWADLMAVATGADRRDVPGAGSAGGVGFALVAALDAELCPGIDLVLRLTGFEARLDGVDLVVTGEGALDEQTLRGKAPAGVAAAARDRGIAVVGVCGRNSLDSSQLAAAGFTAVYALADREPDLARSMTHAAALLEEVGAQIAKEHLAPAGGDRSACCS